MIDRIAVDTNAVVDLFRYKTAAPKELREARVVFVPLHVAGELYAGAYSSRRTATNLAIVEGFLSSHALLEPDAATAQKYGELRASARANSITAAKMVDLWIAALCIQHDLPLLTNDRGFDAVAGLRVLHW